MGAPGLRDRWSSKRKVTGTRRSGRSRRRAILSWTHASRKPSKCSSTMAVMSNDPNAGDPSWARSKRSRGVPIDPSPFQALSMNCRACHMVDDVVAAPGGGMRAYADFATRSPILIEAMGRLTHPATHLPS